MTVQTWSKVTQGKGNQGIFTQGKVTQSNDIHTITQGKITTQKDYIVEKTYHLAQYLGPFGAYLMP